MRPLEKIVGLKVNFITVSKSSELKQ